MRGHVLASCIAASLLAVAGARAADTAGAARVPLSLVAQPSSSRTAEDYLAGSSVLATVAGPSGTSSESGQLLPVLAVTQPYGPPGLGQIDLRNVTARFSLTPELSLDLGYQLDDAARFATV